MAITNLLSDITSASIAAVVAAVGWFVAANRNYHFQHKLQVEREAREAAGFRRIIVADVRMITMRLEPWLSSFARMRLDDLVGVYRALENDLRDKAIVSSLDAGQYEVLFRLLDQFGCDVGFVQSLFERLPPIKDGERQWENSDAERDFRDQVNASFEKSVLLLPSVGEALDDSEIFDRASHLRDLLNLRRGRNCYLGDVPGT